MANITQAIENVRNLSRTFQSVIDLADALEGMASVEQAIREANIALVNATKEKESIDQELIKTQDELAKAQDSLKTIVDDASKRAHQILSAAQANASYLEQAAQDEANEIAANTKKFLSESEQELHDVEAKTAIAAKELADIEAKITRAKAKMAEILGV